MLVCLIEKCDYHELVDLVRLIDKYALKHTLHASQVLTLQDKYNVNQRFQQKILNFKNCRKNF